MTDSAEGTEIPVSNTGDLQLAANESEQVSTVDSKPEKSPVTLRVPSHGKGMIYNGWPKSASSAPRPSPVAALRDRMREGLDKILPSLIDEIASGKVSKLAGLDFLAKYGIGATGTVTIVSPDVIARLEKQANAIASRPQWDTVDLLSVLRDIWT